MEVHAHTHTQRKKWTHYLWEFLMLFFAVFCGFLAEYKLEHIIEHNREKEYIRSMIEDAAADTVNLNHNIMRNQRRAIGLDSLVNLCYAFDSSPQSIRQVYKLWSRYSYRPDVAILTERTISQLKNAGGMRLIKNKAVADSISMYDQWRDKLEEQHEWYNNAVNYTTEFASEVLIFKYYQRNPATNKRNEVDSFPVLELLKQDKITMNMLGNRIERLKGIIMYYKTLLEETDARAIRLIETMKKEYHLK